MIIFTMQQIDGFHYLQLVAPCQWSHLCYIYNVETKQHLVAHNCVEIIYSLHYVTIVATEALE
jgi:hypothetical protein